MLFMFKGKKQKYKKKAFRVIGGPILLGGSILSKASPCDKVNA